LHSFLSWGFFSWAWYAWQPYFLELYGENAIWLSGLIAALFALAGIAGNTLVGRLATPGRRRTTILLVAAAVSTATMVGTGAIRSFWVTVPVFLLGAIAGGVLQPVRQTYLHLSIPLGASHPRVLRFARGKPRQRRRTDRARLPFAREIYPGSASSSGA
jgi:MFS family permease